MTEYLYTDRRVNQPGFTVQTARTPIVGKPVVTLAQAIAWLDRKAADWVVMAELYYSIAPRYNIRPDVALAQACKETGYFRFSNLVKPEQNNFAGLGATGPGSPGASFPDKATGVEAQVQHLYAYATTDPLPAEMRKLDIRFDLVRRGTAPYVEYLGAAENPAGVGWALPGIDYGQSIVRDYLMPMLAMVVREELFKDLAGHWAKQEIEEAAKAGLVGGKGDGAFDPNSPITRAESTVIAMRVYRTLLAKIEALEQRIAQLESGK